MLEALRESRRLLLAVSVLGLFGGAVVARLGVPLDHGARSLVRVEQPELAAADARADRVLGAARALSHERQPVAELRQRIEGEAVGRSQVAITAHADSAAGAAALADAVATALVSDLEQRAAEAHARSEAERRSQLAAAQAERARAETDLAKALQREGTPELEAALGQARARLGQLEGQIGLSRTNAIGAQTRVAVLGAASNSQAAKQAAQALAEAQRALSTLLTQREPGDPAVTQLRDRIRRLQTRAVVPGTLALGHRAEARLEQARVRQLEREAQLERESVARLSEVALRVAPLLAARDRASERLASLERAASAASPTRRPAELHARAVLTSVSNRGLRAGVALLAPLLALLLAVGVIVATELRHFRVCATTELAHFIDAPVVACSLWPARDDRLEALIDELAEHALEAPGTMLVLPLSDVERPLALTLAAQLNARAQRHFRTATGARVTVAQAWEGDSTGPRVKRVAEVADRVLWVVSADSHTGAEIDARRRAITRKRGVAAVLLDARAHGVAPQVGDATGFWSARSESEEAARSVPPPRVPLH